MVTYLCPDAQCLKKAVRSRALEKAFELAIPEEIYAQLNEQMEAGQ